MWKWIWCCELLLCHLRFLCISWLSVQGSKIKEQVRSFFNFFILQI